MKKILICFIKFYQNNISIFKIPCCRFYPSCSQYSIESISIHGVLKGGLLSIYRILRCNPFCKGGVDLVPNKIFNKKRRINND